LLACNILIENEMIELEALHFGDILLFDTVIQINELELEGHYSLVPVQIDKLINVSKKWRLPFEDIASFFIKN
jgi:hypothetical protein